MNIIRPSKGFQEKFIRSRVDFAIGGGSAGVGKTFASCLIPAYYVNNSKYRAVLVRKNLGEITAGGGMIDELLEIYPKDMFSRMAESGNPVFQFTSGAEITLTHLADENINKLNERIKGWQYDYVYLDELTAYEWSTVSSIMTRNRGGCGTPAILRATTNPKKNSWVRRWLDWYIGEDGFIREDRDGVVRFFYMMGTGVDDVVWGDSREEVYYKCKYDIDKKLKAVGETNLVSVNNMIKSFVFYRGRLAENSYVLTRDAGYVGSLAMAGGARAQQLLEGNWNVDDNDDDQLEITRGNVLDIFENNPNTSGRKVITADIALGGTDNMIILVWDGFHIIDKLVIQKTDAPGAIRAIRNMQMRYGVLDKNIVFDATSIGTFIGGETGFLKKYTPFISQWPAVNNPNYANLKSQCADKLISLIKGGLISAKKEIGDSIYYHQKLKTEISFRERLVNEFRALRFDSRVDNMINAKKRLITKKRMVEILGSSPDILDSLIIRMYLDIDYVGNTDQYMKSMKQGTNYDSDIEDDDYEDIVNYM